jgi:hypothetical protein
MPSMGYHAISYWRGRGILGVYSLGHDGMQGALYCREISGGGRDRVGDRDAVTATGAADASDDGVVAPLLTGYLIVVGRGFGGFHAGGKGTGTAHELNELLPAKVEPYVPVRPGKTARPCERAA